MILPPLDVTVKRIEMGAHAWDLVRQEIPEPSSATPLHGSIEIHLNQFVHPDDWYMVYVGADGKEQICKGGSVRRKSEAA